LREGLKTLAYIRFMTYLGFDPTSSESKPSGWAALGASAELLGVGGVGGDTEIISLTERWRAKVVAIDSPLFLPKGLRCLEEPCLHVECSGWTGERRVAEQDLYRQGIRLYWTTRKSFIKPMIYRAMALRRTFEARGIPVIEVYPHASKVRLFGRRIPKKTTTTGRVWLRERLANVVPGLAEHPARLGHDQLDAIVAAYTAYLHGRGVAEGVGDPDEGMIWVPRAVTLS
jgi:predicted nuclease with RNAse H fold